MKENETLKFYNENSEEYFNNTVNLNLESLYKEFLKNIPKKSNILDVGCGAGAASKYFLDNGYKVSAFDGSKKLAIKSSRYLKQKVDNYTFQNFKYKEKFDGIWASASLLHLPKSEIKPILKKLNSYLKPGGTFYFSLKEGEGEKVIGDRFFSFYTQNEVENLIKDLDNIKISNVYITKDIKKHEVQKEKWISFKVENTELKEDLNIKNEENPSLL